MTADAITINEAQDEIVEEFELFGDDADMRNSYIIDLGRKLPPMPAEYHTDQYIVKGCQSQVWVHTNKQNDRLYFDADSNAAIPKGLIALAVRLYSGRTPEEIAETPPDFIERIGMSKHISSGRSNGLLAVIGRMKQEAASALSSQSEK
jgi:cysteine desulfuration protein SufE